MRELCPAEAVIAAYLKRQATPEERQLVEAHLNACDECCELAAFMVRLKNVPGEKPAADAPAS